MLIDTLINKYLQNVSLYNSKGTYDFSLEICNDIKNYFKNIDVSKIDSDMVYNYINYLKSKNLSNSTINKRVLLLKRLFKFNNISFDFSSIRKLKERFITYGFLDPFELDKFHKAINDLDLFKKSLLLLFIDSGVRVNELIHIKTRNVDLLTRSIFLEETKTNTPRYVYFSQYTCNILKKYFMHYKGIKNEYMFFSLKDNSKILSRYTVNSIFKRIKVKYDFKKLSPHMLRHTLSTNLYNNGANLLFISNLLGHSNPNTTKRYIHNDIKNDLKIYDSYYKSLT